MRKHVTLALQGGGALGAFTWGVLDAFLADDRLEVVGISGTSAGAMNAVVYAEGLRRGGPEAARKHLEKFWRGVSLDGSLTPEQREFFDIFFGMFDPLNLRLSMASKTTEIFSPYEINPLEINPLREIVEDLIDFDFLRQTTFPKLFVSATNVQTGRAKIFRHKELSADAIMASACLPTLFKAVEIDGQFYWDGGYMGNPALYPLYTETKCSDIILIQVNPLMRPEIPKTSAHIMDRLNEITFNSALLHEFRAIEFVTRLLESGRLDGSHYKKVRLHMVAGGEAVDRYGASAKMDLDYTMFEDLFSIGVKAGRDFLENHFDSIGVKATLDLQEQLGFQMELPPEP